MLDFEKPEVLEKVIHFLIDEKLITNNSREEIYNTIDHYAMQRNDSETRIFFVEKILMLANASTVNKHKALCNYKRGQV